MQGFKISDGSLHHSGTIIRTPKFLKEEQADKFLYSAFDMLLEEDLPVTQPNDINVANTSVLPIGDELFALWEGGSALQINPQTLEPIGFKTWGDGLQGVPFSAHPKVDRDGTIWNFGQDVVGNRLVLYKISPQGKLLSFWVINDVAPGMMHDFCITDNHLVFCATSLRAVRSSPAFLRRFEWQADAPQQVVILNKADPSIRRNVDFPPGFQFHFGNAYDGADGSLHFTYCASSPDFILGTARDVLRGKLQDRQSSTLCEAKIDNEGSITITEHITNMDGQEFPQYARQKIGLQTQYLYLVARNSNRQPLGSNLVKFDQKQNSKEMYDLGEGTMVEEHLFIPRKNGEKEDDGWLIGTALDFKAQKSLFNIFDAKSLSSGPICQFELDAPMPLGFHGCWVAS